MSSNAHTGTRFEPHLARATDHVDSVQAVVTTSDAADVGQVRNGLRPDGAATRQQLRRLETTDRAPPSARTGGWPRGSPERRTAGLRQALAVAAEWERHHRPSAPPPILTADQRRRSRGDRLAGVITDFAGSMRFVYLHTLWFGLWVASNAGLLVAVGIGLVAWDPFPFGLLTLIVSLEAIFLSTFVMIAQNRQAALADARAKADYAVNVRAEAEIARLLHFVQALVEYQVDLTAQTLNGVTSAGETVSPASPTTSTPPLRRRSSTMRTNTNRT